jgi:RNA polymerase sigma-70 factor (ECF subfamily)
MNTLLADQQRFERIAAGDQRSFRELVELHHRPLVTYVTRLMGNQSEAEEIVQEVFVRVWQRATDYRVGYRATTWLHRIGHNLAVDQLRRRRGNREVDEEEDFAPPSQRPHELLEHKQRTLSLREALDTLPLKQKTAMLLKYEQDFANPEIGKVLELSVEAVESLIARGKRQLKLLLAEEDLTHD